MRKYLPHIGGWIYGIQLFLIVPWFLGACYRGEQSVWFWKEYQEDLLRHGSSDAWFSVYLYAVFYSALIVLPYWLLMLNAKRRMPQSASSRGIVFIIASWSAITSLLFAKPIFAFIRNLPSDVWNGWLLIGWAVITFCVILLWHSMKNLDETGTHGAALYNDDVSR